MLPPPAPSPAPAPSILPPPSYLSADLPPGPVDKVRLAEDVATWETLTKWISVAKEQEMTLRKSIADRMFGHLRQANGMLPAGTKRVEEFGRGFKMVGKINREILVEEIPAVIAELATVTPLAADLVKTKYELSWTVYKLLTDDQKKIADRLYTEKQGTITLEVE